MSKVPVSASPYSKPNTASSAWTRLVQTTKSASKTSRHGDAKSPGARRQSPPVSINSMAELSRSRPVKRRRITGSRTPQSAAKSSRSLSSIAAVPGQDAGPTEALPGELAIVPAGPEQDHVAVTHTEVSLCSDGEKSWPNIGCSSTTPSKHKSTSTGAPLSSPTHADLRTFWGPRIEDRQVSRDNLSQIGDEAEIGEVEEGITARSAGNGKTLALKDDGSEHDIEEELPRQWPEKLVLDNARSGVARWNMTDVIDKAAPKPTRRAPAESTRATSRAATRHSDQSSSPRVGFRTRRRYRLGRETRNADNRPEPNGQATITKNVSNKATDEEEKNSPARATPSGSATGLHEDLAQTSLNRSPEVATPILSHTPTSASEKENAGPTRKAKRRLTLHDTKIQPQKKKCKAALKQSVQTTLALAIGGNPGMRECKVCDTVYNPLHPEDVKVHAKRHAGVMRKEKRSAEI
ncbi:hypothetical protein N0V93_008174 [Gnomoniopsis smithogilvyi]|uniref:N-acetyltransferase ESCO zinc-finger domain-containing protein n=1 Tax=Gnomoniopsis smithogilvyi TaxID=1191159 RepID=A0A9W8YL75_9PEZI|nr:hypothetical protein N0V93_008174 [Gnomoniopsis smithogilvyi]